MYPKFLGIGAQKAGTTWLHAMLAAHEEIWLPHLKELHYFDRRFPIKEAACASSQPQKHSGIDHRIRNRLRRLSLASLRERLRFQRWNDIAWEFRYMFGRWDDAWYASLFEQARERLPGEITPAYSCLSEAAIAHVHALMPSAKLIFLLRDPVERAWSHAKMDLTRELRRLPNDIPASKYIIHFSSHASRTRGDYQATISRWLTKYPAEQLFIGFYDEIESDPCSLLTRILHYLGVSVTRKNMHRDIHKPVNVGPRVAIPPDLNRYLAALYIDDVRSLADQFGSFPRQWLRRCESALCNVSGNDNQMIPTR